MGRRERITALFMAENNRSAYTKAFPYGQNSIHFGCFDYFLLIHEFIVDLFRSNYVFLGVVYRENDNIS